MSLPDILFVTAGLLILAMTAASVCRHLPIPYTVLLFSHFKNDGF